MICDECETVAHCMKNGCVPKTTKKDEAMKLALEALENAVNDSADFERINFDECEKAITALREALNASLAEQPARLDLPDFIAGALGVSRGTAYDMMREALAEESSGTEQPAQQAPVAWQVEMFIAGEWAPLGNPQRSKTKAEALASNPALPKEHQRLFPVYTSPPAQRKPLTNEEITKAFNEAMAKRPKDASNAETNRLFARAIEAAHGIKEKNCD